MFWSREPPSTSPRPELPQQIIPRHPAEARELAPLGSAHHGGSGERYAGAQVARACEYAWARASLERFCAVPGDDGDTVVSARHTPATIGGAAPKPRRGLCATVRAHVAAHISTARCRATIARRACSQARIRSTLLAASCNGRSSPRARPQHPKEPSWPLSSAPRIFTGSSDT